MLNLLKALRQDEHGVILSTEIVIIGSLLVIGLISGLTCLQKSVNSELRDVASAIDALDQSYSFSAHRKSGFGGQCCAYTAGSSFVNCERQATACGDIIGCEPCLSGVSESCCPTGVLTGVPEGGICSSCGGHAAGCSACGGVANGSVRKDVRCIDTGVPRMKVTEWNTPSGISSQVESTTEFLPDAPVLVLPAEPQSQFRSEGNHQHVHPAAPNALPHHARDPHHAGEQSGSAGPAAAEPTPKPATEPLPAPVPMPSPQNKPDTGDTDPAAPSAT